MTNYLLLMSKVACRQEQFTRNLGADIIEAIADRERISPAQLSPPLYSVISPDALTSLFQPTASSDRQRESSVCFTYCGYNVYIDNNHNITIESLDKADTNDFSTELNLSTTVKWERDTENTPVHAVVSAVAEVEETDPVDLPPLYDAINPEALNELFTSQSDSSVAQITFEYAGYAIVVRGSGVVEVRSA